MKRIVAFIMVTTFLVTACHVQNANGQVSGTNAAYSQETAGGQTTEGSENSQADTVETADSQIEEPDRGFKAKIGKKIGSMLSEKIDTAKQSVYADLDPELSTWPTKGDDGSCYYFRKKGEGKNEKLVFYKNNGIKVCETTIEKSIKEKYYIDAFVKYGNRFFLALDYIFYEHDDYDDANYDANDDVLILATIDMESGKWGEAIKVSRGWYEDMMVYEDCFYLKDRRDGITRYDLSGERLELKNVASDDSRQHIQCIVDGKIYYIVTTPFGKFDRIVRTNLDGSGKETLFKYKYSVSTVPGSLQIDGDYMYLTGKFGKVDCLARIPLYGGKIKKVAEIADYNEDWFALSDDSIFLYKRKGHYIYKVNKNLRGKAKTVTKVYYPKSYEGLAAPHCYADGHLMMQGYNRKEHKSVDYDLHHIEIDSDLYALIKENYADDYYWVSEDGEVEDVIKGSGLKRWT